MTREEDPVDHTSRATRTLHELEGRHANIQLSDGSQVQGTVISYGRGQVSTVWLEVDGTDLFIPRDTVMSAWGQAA
jgi:hypothetical protein